MAKYFLLAMAFTSSLCANYLGAPPKEEECGFVVDNDHSKREEHERPNLYDEQFDELRNGSALPRRIPRCHHCCQTPCDSKENNTTQTPQE